MAALDWPGMMRAGIRGLGMSPDEFWSLSPAELLLMLGQEKSAQPMNRNGLEELLRAFPDGPSLTEKGERHE